MILLDTHVWVRWFNGDPQLPQDCVEIIKGAQGDGLGVSVISCWEVSMLVAKGRLQLTTSVEEWVAQALLPREIHLVGLTPDIAIASTTLPGTFHADPADRIIVATARVLGVALVTLDGGIRAYPHVKTLP